MKVIGHWKMEEEVMKPDRVKQFLEHMLLEREELREDLLGISLDQLERKVGDFGCGWGYITWCLMLEIRNSSCIGVDRFDPGNPPELEDIFSDELFTINNVQNRFNLVSQDLNSDAIKFQEHELLRDLYLQLSLRKNHPAVQRGDLLTGEDIFPNLSLFFNLIYCKRVLYNIFLGDNKSPDRDSGISLAINHISNALKPDGWFCFIDIENLRTSSTLEVILRQAGFTFELPRRVHRRYKTIQGDHDQFPYLIYHCRKTG